MKIGSQEDPLRAPPSDNDFLSENKSIQAAPLFDKNRTTELICQEKKTPQLPPRKMHGA
jgi:hypothetical protein